MVQEYQYAQFVWEEIDVPISKIFPTTLVIKCFVANEGVKLTQQTD